MKNTKNKALKLVSSALAGLMLMQSTMFAANGVELNQLLEQLKLEVPESVFTPMKADEMLTKHPIYQYGKEHALTAERYMLSGDCRQAIITLQEIPKTKEFFATQSQEVGVAYEAGVHSVNINYGLVPNSFIVGKEMIPLADAIMNWIYTALSQYITAIHMQDYKKAMSMWEEYQARAQILNNKGDQEIVKAASLAAIVQTKINPTYIDNTELGSGKIEGINCARTYWSATIMTSTGVGVPAALVLFIGVNIAVSVYKQTKTDKWKEGFREGWNEVREIQVKTKTDMILIAPCPL